MANKSSKTLQKTLLFVLIFGLLFYLFLPKFDLANLDYSTVFFDRNSNLLKVSLSARDNYRIYTDLTQVNPDYIEAVLLYEDKYFYYHFGINPISLLRSAYASLTGNRLIGGSTISMQVARMKFNLTTNNILGKLKQIYIALALERHYSKNDILTTYINLLPFGGNIYGVEAASRIYFNRTSKTINLPQIITLAIIPQNPNKRQGVFYSLPAKQNLIAKWQAEYGENPVLNQLVEQDLIVGKRQNLPNHAPHLTSYLSLKNKNLPKKVITSLDLELQQDIENIVNQYISNKKYQGVNNAVVLVLDAKSMEVRAMLGSADFYNSKIAGQVNGVIAKRSPGSTLKPFIYAMALEQGLIHPKTMLADVPSYYGAYQPENFDKKYRGLLDATSALVYSRNLPAINLANQIRPDLYDFLQAGLANLPELRDYYGMGLALGGVDLSMEKLVELYASLANFGVYKNLSYITSEPSKVQKCLLSAEAAYLTLNMLSHNKLGAKNENAKDFFAWKTGTSYAFRDAWTLGVVNDYVLGVWIGNFDASSNHNFVGATMATPLWMSIGKYLVNNNIATKRLEYAEPLDIRTIKICAPSGDLPNKFCPHLGQTQIINGITKLQVDKVFKQVKIDKKTGLRFCDYTTAKASSYTTKTFAFWDLQVENLFSKAGIYVEKAPPYKNLCLNNATKNNNLKIILPNAKSVLAFDAKQSRAKIIFKAMSRNTKKFYWFLDDKFIGITQDDEVLIYYVDKPGKFHAKAIDDSGELARINFVVESIL